MKILSLILTLLLFSFLSFAQQNTIKITMSEMTWLFKGYDVKIEISPLRKAKRYTIECVGCSKVKKIQNTSNEWIISSNEADSVVVSVKNRFGKVLHEKTIRVFQPPRPSIHVDHLDEQNVIRTAPDTLSLKHENWIPLIVNFIVVSWNCTIDNLSFSGNGKKISDDVRNAMLATKSGFISFEINYYDPFGLKKMKGIWEFNLG